MNTLLERLLCAMVFLVVASLVQSQAVNDKNTVLAQAESLMNVDGKIAAARYLEQQYAHIEPLEDSIAVLNRALQYYYEADAHESLRTLAERALANIKPMDERTWQTLSQVYGQLGRYYLQVENNPDAALPLMQICDDSWSTELGTWCARTRATILKDRKLAYRALINERVSDKVISYWTLLLIVLLSIGVFAYRLLRRIPKQKF